MKRSKWNNRSACDLRGGAFGIFVQERQVIALRQATAKNDTVRVHHKGQGVGKFEA